MEFDHTQWIILIKLLIAHFLSDFVLQFNSWVRHRKTKGVQSLYLYAHSAIAGLLSYILIAQWSWWYVPVVIFVSHALIDIWKSRQNGNPSVIFVIDQGLHVITLFVFWLIIIGGFETLTNIFSEYLNSEKILLIILGYTLILWPSGIFIREVTIKWQNQIHEVQNESKSLNNAGKWIGFLERILVLTFVLINQFGAIGFLIAAKSILRLNPNDQTIPKKYTEYVLFGTLLSFTIAIITGLLIRIFIK